MVLYHGSEKIITRPQAEYRNTANDYGAGFYCTESAELAGEWACKKNTDGFVNRYELSMDGLQVLRLNEEPYHILHWMALLTRYRGYWQRHSIAEEAKDYLQANFLPDISSTDMIIGYRADDSYFAMAQDFVSNAISLQQLSEALRLGKLGEQVVLKSEKAFSGVKYLGNEYARAELFYGKKTARDLGARRQYAELRRKQHVDDIFMLDLMRGRVSADELRI